MVVATTDTEYAHGRSQPLCGLVARGPALAPAEVEFLKAGGAHHVIVTADATGVTLGRLADFFARRGPLRSEFAFWRLNNESLKLLNSCNFLWLPDPWLRLSTHGASVAMRRNIPYVVTVWENLEYHVSTFWPMRAKLRSVLTGASLVHCVTEGARRYVARIAPRVATVQIYPGVNLEMFSPLPAQLRPSARSNRYIFLFVGRLVPEKGILDLVRAYERVRLRWGTGVELVIVGEGPLAVHVARLAKTESGIQFLGTVPHDRLPEVMRKCQALILPSRPRKIAGVTVWSEQFGFVLIEAMACGLPVLGTRCGAIPEIIGDAGIVVDNGLAPVEGLSKGMEELLRRADRWGSDCEAARRRARECFSGEVNSAELWRQISAAL